MPHIQHEGKTYLRYRLYGEKEYYHCTKNRGGCGARIIRNGDNILLVGSHSCDTIANETTGIAQVASFATKFVTKHATDIALFPQVIYERLILALNNEFAGQAYDVPSKRAIMNHIRTLRSQHACKDTNLIEEQQLAITLSGRIFLRRNWFGGIIGKYHRIVI